jgi:hypothetical protein
MYKNLIIIRMMFDVAFLLLVTFPSLQQTIVWTLPRVAPRSCGNFSDSAVKHVV